MKVAFIAALLVAAAQAQTTAILQPVTNAQAESCKSDAFELATNIDAKREAICANGHTSVQTGGPCNKLEPLAYANVMWNAGVPIEKWSFDEITKTDPYPLGFRRNIIQHNNGGVMCLKIPEIWRDHKIEVAVETSVKGMICIADTRAASLNLDSNHIVSRCDASGQLIACFSTLVNGDESTDPASADSQAGVNGQLPAEVGGVSVDPVTPSSDSLAAQPMPSSQFGIIIGCPGTGCWETDFEVFYRVRVSKTTWKESTQPVNQAEGQLDMWCMMMGQRDRVGVGGVTEIQKKLAESQTWPVDVRPPNTIEGALGDDLINQFPQLFPSDLWEEKNGALIENEPACATAAGCNTPAQPVKVGETGYVSSATSVAATAVAFVLPVIALLF